MAELYKVGNPINRDERANLNATFEDILARFSSMQNTLSLLTGGQDVDELVSTIQNLISETQVALTDIEESLSLSEQATSDANAATTNANNEADRAKDEADYIDSVKSQIDYFVGEQTNLQAQINQLVVSGDSSPEAAQARVGYTGTTYASLKARLDAEANLSIPGSKTFINNSVLLSDAVSTFNDGITITIPQVNATNATYMNFMDTVNQVLDLNLSYSGVALRFHLTTIKRSANVQALQFLEVRSNSNGSSGNLFFTLERQFHLSNPVWTVKSNLIRVSGNPNGVINAIKGVMAVDTNTGTIYRKDTGTTNIPSSGWVDINEKIIEFNDAVLINGFQGSVKYKKNGNGLVTVRVNLTSIPTNSNGISFVNIPEGFRPQLNLPVPSTIFVGTSFSSVSNPYTIRTNGNMVFINGEIISPNTNRYSSEVSYYVDL